MNASAEYGTVDVEVVRYRDRNRAPATDTVVVEEPLEIQVLSRSDSEYRSLCTTMRTPGHDEELAVGFLFNEAVIRAASQVRQVSPWGPFRGTAHVQNVSRVELDIACIDFGKLERHFYSNSSCGVCGRASVAALMECVNAPLPSDGPSVDASVLVTLPERLRNRQDAFDCTGGLHATALFDSGGELLLVREDVGRHNAVDKVAGRLLLDGRVPAAECVMTVSGRLSFEIVQKTVMLGVPVLCGIGAPSSLAVDLAGKTGLTLVGFLRDGRFNVYSNPWRIAFDA
jgi:FdhD protein